MVKDAQYWIRKLNLTRHPEGGYYKESYRADELIPLGGLPQRFTQEHCFSTAIYFLLESGDFSALHRIKSDEIWHYYFGSSLTLYSIDSDGMLFKIRLGPDLDNGQIFQAHIKAGNWFGAKVNDHDSYTLVGCTVAPGFEFGDFKLAKRSNMLAQFPRHQQIIKELTRR